MNFGLSEEQEILQSSVGQYLEKECPANRLRDIFEGEDGFDAALWQGMVEMGLAGLVIPEEFGGAGLEILDLGLVSEVLGRAATPGPFLGHTLAGLAILRGGSEEQKQRWLPRLASGEALGSVALCESRDRAGAEGWGPEDWKLSAAAELSGTRPHVLYGSRADLIVVGVENGLCVVEGSAAGVQWTPVKGADRSRRTDDLTLDGTPAERLPDGASAAQFVRDAGLVALSADAFGGASRLIQDSVEYAKTRVQFGVPIAHFQAVKHQLANMATAIEPARSLYWYAAHALDQIPEAAPRQAAIAKAHLTDQYLQIARESVELHGGIGFTWECDVQMWFKRAMFDRAFLGTPSLHRERAAVLADW